METSNVNSSSTSQKKFFGKDYDSYDSAMTAYDKYKSRGYGDNDIALLMSDETRKKYQDTSVHPERLEDANKTLEGTGVGSAVGGVIGASVAAIAAIGTSLIIPGLGLVVAGPIAAALAGAGAGGLAGGLVGALVGLGLDKTEAESYDEKIKSGKIIVGANPRNDDDHHYFQNNL